LEFWLILKLLLFLAVLLELRPLPPQLQSYWEEINQNWQNYKMAIVEKIIKPMRTTEETSQAEQISTTSELKAMALAVIRPSDILVTKLGEFTKINSQNLMLLQILLGIFNITVLAAILYLIVKMLKPISKRKETFKDPGEALRRFMQVDPSYYNLVVTDIRMPNINGFQLYEKLKEIKRDVRVLFMTAFEIGTNQLDSMPRIHESDIIRKPIEEESFVSMVKRAVNIR
jgi:CheY-like chemotaxis protein